MGLIRNFQTGKGILENIPSMVEIGMFSGITQLWHNLPEIF